MKRRYNHETKQWDIVLSEEQYTMLQMRIEALEKIIISQPKSDIIQVTGQPCYPPFFAKVQSCCKLPDGADLAGIDMAHNEQVDTFRFRGFN
jgi:bifunctional pyridoxal-dependent enzyme with beta-cystathionase and maltose regulon repressor activities